MPLQADSRNSHSRRPALKLDGASSWRHVLASAEPLPATSETCLGSAKSTAARTTTVRFARKARRRAFQSASVHQQLGRARRSTLAEPASVIDASFGAIDVA
jgi:hypothetical protein